MPDPGPVFRTPDERFKNLPDFPYEPRYREWRGIRLAHLDEGDGPPVMLLHGEPTWSFLYRKVMEPLMEAGYRCIVPDLPGFGRSDKPTDESWYTYESHTAAIVSLFEELDLQDTTLVMQDWGGPIGFRAATMEVPERVSRFVVMDTGIFTGEQQMSEDWLRFRNFVARVQNTPVKRLIRGACKTPPTPEVLAAYEAPFPNVESKAGVRTFPQLVPLEPNAPGAIEGQTVTSALAQDTRPTLLLWADSDPVLPLDPVGVGMKRLLQVQEMTVIEDAGHFLQEDQGKIIGFQIADWLAGQ